MKGAKWWLNCFIILTFGYLTFLVKAFSTWNAPQFSRLLGFDYGVHMYVRSAPNEFQIRAAIRNTWGGLSRRLNVKTLFFVGWSSNSSINAKLVDELNDNDDLIVLPIIDHYRNLTRKQLLIFEWHQLHTQHLPHPVIFVWMSSDVFVYPTVLLSMLYELDMSRADGRILGKCICDGPANGAGCRRTRPDDRSMYPARNRAKKYYLSKRVWPYRQFPNFCVGFAAVLTPDLPARMLDLARTTAWTALDGHFEDVLFLGVFARHLNLTFVRSRAFCESLQGEMKNSTSCAFVHARDSQAYSRVTAEGIRQMWHYHNTHLERSIEFRDVPDANRGRWEKEMGNSSESGRNDIRKDNNTRNDDNKQSHITSEGNGVKQGSDANDCSQTDQFDSVNNSCPREEV